MMGIMTTMCRIWHKHVVICLCLWRALQALVHVVCVGMGSEVALYVRLSVVHAASSRSLHHRDDCITIFEKTCSRKIYGARP